ncbi:MAG: hypothetical protein KatS3mg060_1183 [Dehalococcoidia bacterium]|nr:MAG: hypothetical protein KatS3mg060_1183 [Dehalococcoidia bacterium]
MASRVDRGFSAWLRAAMERAGIASQVELAARVGVNQSTVSHWLHGAWPRVIHLGPLARALGVSRREIEWYAGLAVAPPAQGAVDEQGVTVGDVAPIPLDAIAAARRTRLADVGGMQATDQAALAGDEQWSPAPRARYLDRLQAGGLAAVVVAGSCLAPEVLAGDIVLVDRHDLFPRPGALVAVLTDTGDVLVKRLDMTPSGLALVDSRGAVYRPEGAVTLGRVVFVVRPAE